MDGESLDIDREPYDGVIWRRRTSYLPTFEAPSSACARRLAPGSSPAG
jgi:hypothetical protein